MKLTLAGVVVLIATLMLGVPVRGQDRYPSSAITVVTPRPAPPSTWRDCMRNGCPDGSASR
jgi:hypothetical protein